MVSFSIPLPTICDRHSHCAEADAWAKRFGRTVQHPNRRVGQTKPYGRPACSEPGCNRLVLEWGMGHAGHVDLPTRAS
jgi:hypothetical protein